MIEALSGLVSGLSMLVKSMGRSAEVYRDGMWAMFIKERVLIMLDWCKWLRLSSVWWVVFSCWWSQWEGEGFSRVGKEDWRGWMILRPWENGWGAFLFNARNISTQSNFCFNLLKNGHVWHFGFCFNKHIYKEMG